MGYTFFDFVCIPMVIIVFRETLEAAVLVAVLLQYLDRKGQPQLKRDVWLGTGLGGLLSVFLACIILSIYYTQRNKLGSSTANLVEGIMLGVASIVISYFLVTHLAPGAKDKESWSTKWERKMDELVEESLKNGDSKKKRTGFFCLSFSSVIREGFETCIFIIGLGAACNPTALPFSIAFGVILGVVIAVAMWMGSTRLSLNWFFTSSALLLALIAAGLAAHSSYELQKGEFFGAWSCERVCEYTIVTAQADPNEAGAYGLLASYAPVSDVTEHSKIDLDVYDLSQALENFQWDTAWDAYDLGGNSQKGDAFRTLRGFSKDLSGEPTYDEFIAYHEGDALYADKYVRAALWDRLSDESTAKISSDRPELWSDVTLSDPMAIQLARKTIQYQHTWIYSTHELYSALSKCRAGNVNDASGAPHAWDEGWAFYVGSLAGEDGKASGELTYALADKRCSNFDTCVDDDPLPSWRDLDDGANSNVNAKLLRLYRAGQQAVRDPSRCDEAESYVESIIAQMSVPLVQGALRYAWRSDPNGGDETVTSDGETLAEFVAFAEAILPRVAHCDANAAAVIAANTVIPSDLNNAIPDGFAAVKSAFESTYSCLSITCSDIGGLSDGNGGFISGMESCEDGSSVEDDSYFWDGIEYIAINQRVPIASYAPVSDVTDHAMIDLDVADMSNALNAVEWDSAWNAYDLGGNSEKGDAFRTLRGFSKDLSGEPTYDEFIAYHDGDALYADKYVRAALWDRLSDDSTAKTSGDRPELWSDLTLTDVMAQQLALKGVQYQHTWIYSTHELYSSLSKCEAGNVDDNSGAPHAWDEGWAFYAGSLAGVDGKTSGQLSYALADKRCGNFGTCVDDDPLPAWRTSDDGANSNVNAKLLRLYRAGQQAVRDLSRCDEARGYVDLIISQMSVSLIQGAIRYAWRSDPNGGGETVSSDGKTLAEFNAFAQAILPRIASCDAAAAAVIATNAAIPSDLNNAVPGGFAAVKTAFESAYSCLAITCSDVGGLTDGLGGFVSGMEPCEDGSSVDDDTAYWDNIELLSGQITLEEDCPEDDDDGWHSYRRQLWTSRMHSCDGKGQSIAWVNREVYDIEACCDTDHPFWFLLMTLFWYRPAATRLEIIVWFAFWIILFLWGFAKVRAIKEINAELEEIAHSKCQDKDVYDVEYHEKSKGNNFELVSTLPTDNNDNIVISSGEQEESKEY
eukprot:CAMPEP_0197301794 /NCGR_PEP_ID=MMETSP0890-20130614/50624_1 /TAXON_ID=44058 ORGANISM="Aureoumbra lagunensis, Strain CCMP1510" /NCGR_SAMPLE_ID=MMETSP0890 /ASSEMBLY_ACC=CAM_ASM_000533 /LENGTH=1198 /DNA_ID=CAMNT_0042781187 /DNA_START=143 /DNA_END=3739 /DNA_ORIENTATION=-